MTHKWILRHKQLLWYYYQVLRSLGGQARYTSKTYIYERAAKKAGYEDWQTAARVLRGMQRDGNICKYIESINSFDEIE